MQVSQAGVVIGSLDGVIYKLHLDGSLAWHFVTVGQVSLALSLSLSLSLSLFSFLLSLSLSDV